MIRYEDEMPKNNSRIVSFFDDMSGTEFYHIDENGVVTEHFINSDNDPETRIVSNPKYIARIVTSNIINILSFIFTKSKF